MNSGTRKLISLVFRQVVRLKWAFRQAERTRNMIDEKKERLFIRVLYDGSCSICSRQAEKWKNRDRGGRIEWVDIAAENFQLEETEIALERLWQEIHVLTVEGEVFVGLDALIMIWKQFPRKPIFYYLARIPGVAGIMRQGYRLLARNRHRISASVASDCSYREQTKQMENKKPIEQVRR